MRVVLMGAGHIGQVIAWPLCGSGDYQLKVADFSVVALKSLNHLEAETELVDTADAA